MSDELLRNELLKNDEPEVEGHVNKIGANDEADTEVEGHGAWPPKYGASDEPREDDEVEGHVHRRS